MRRSLVAGNWKMNGSRTENAALIRGLLDAMTPGGNTEVLVCPPHCYVADVAELIRGTSIALGGQNVAAEKSGAFTGEVSAAMLADVGCRYAIVGHSERRALYGENDALVARKFRIAQANDLIPVLCVGETRDERESNQTETVVVRQLRSVLDAAGVESFADAVVAYEPVWAIGTGLTATPDQAQAVHALIRRIVADQDARIAASLQVLYGGSVKADNASTLFAEADIDGGLVGGASLKVEQFAAIVNAAG